MILYFLIVFGLYFGTQPLPSIPSFDKPNILWLVAEDLSPVLPMYGDSTISTPTLSRLAREGVKYTHVFSPSGVCAPSRAALATGLYPSRVGAHHMRNGFWAGGRPNQQMINAQASAFPPGLPMYEAILPEQARMHSEYLRRAGYYCTNRAKQDYQFVAPVTAWDECSPRAHWRNRKPNQPFFAVFNFEVTHESQIWSKAKDSLWVDPQLKVKVPPYLPATEIALNDIRRMYSNIKEMDYQVGNVLKQLEEDGLLENTIVFWYSDHGGPLPRQKRLCYDSGLRAPLIIRFPKRWRAGEEDHQLISFVDFLPTLLSLAGIKPNIVTDGRSFAGKYESKTKRKYIHGAADRFDEKYDMIRAVRDGRFKYLRNYQLDKPYYLAVKYREQMPIMQELIRLNQANLLNEFQAQWFRPKKDAEELFDTTEDPYELHNLTTDKKYASKLNELRGECDRWMKSIQDKGMIDEPEYIRQIWGGPQQPLTADPMITKSRDIVKITCPTKGASIGYQLVADGKTPSSWAIYSTPVKIKSGEKMKVVAHRIGYLPSAVAEVE